MISQTPWAERTFNFDFPVGYFPSLFERLIGTPARIRELVLDEPEEMLIRKPENKWSVKEHVGHLTDLEALHEKRMDEFLTGEKTLTPADMSNEKTTSANHNSKTIGELVALFSTTRHAFAHRVFKLNDEMLQRIALHPRLKKNLRLIDLIFFDCEHDDHHLAKIRNLLTKKS